MGVALCALFSVAKDVANVNDIMDSRTSFKLICHLKASNGPNDLSVKPRHIYWPTKEDLMMSLKDRFLIGYMIAPALRFHSRQISMA